MATEQDLINLSDSLSNYMEKIKNRVDIDDFAIIENQEELNEQLGLEQSFGEVFDEWDRISHANDDNTLDQPANLGELDSWVYNSQDDTIENTSNSATLIGFISPEGYDDYTFEVTVKSSDTDNDSIGVCFGFAVDEFGFEHTLTALRTVGGSQAHASDSGFQISNESAKLFDVYYDRTYDHRIDLGSTNGGLIWGDTGVADDGRVPGADVGDWSAWPDGCRIKVTRSGDIITLETTDLGSTTYVPTATVVVDLNSHPELEIFKGPSPYGYVAYSQIASTWDVHSRPGARVPIVDLLNNKKWEWDGTQWLDSSINNYPEVDILPLDKKFYYNPYTEKLFYYDGRRGVSNVAKTGVIDYNYGEGVLYTSDKLDTGEVHKRSFVVSVDGIIYFNLGHTDETPGVAGGLEYKPDFYSFNPTTRVFTRLADMPRGYINASAVNVGGLIYVMGGYYDDGVTTGREKVDVYDPATDTWSALTDSPISTGSMYDGSFTHLYGSQILVAADTAVYSYDLVTETWSTLGGTASMRLYAFTPLNGLFYSPRISSTTPYLYVYDPEAETWSTLTPPSLIDSANNFTVFPFQGKIYKLGGSIYDSNHREVEAYDPVADSWSTLSSMPAGTEWANCVYTEDNGDIYILNRSASIDNAGSDTDGISVSRLNIHLL